MNDYTREQQRTDKGWQQMRQLLDQEMPVKKRRRFLIWIPLALLLAIAGGAAVYSSYQTGGNGKKNLKTLPVQQSTTDQPVAAIEVPSSKGLKTETAEATATLQTQEESADNLPAENKARIVNKGTRSIPNTCNLPSIIVQDPAPATSNIAAQVVARPEIAIAANDAVEVVRETGLQPVNVTSNNSIRFLEVGLQTVNPMQLEPIETHEAPVKAFHLINSRMPQRWAYGITSSVGTQRFTAVNTVSAGLFAEFRPFRKWGVRSGLSYSFLRPAGIARPLASVRAYEYVDATGNYNLYEDINSQPGATPIAASSIILIGAEQFHRLEVPVQIVFTPVKKLNLYAGLITNRTFYAKTSNKSLAEESAVILYNQYEKKALNDLVIGKLQRWSMDWNASVGYRLNKRLEIGASYRNALAPKRRAQGNTLSSSLNNSPTLDSQINRTSFKRENRPLWNISGTIFF